ncbi:MAG TPA: TetR/AcrR family transcriptional regulator [Patescibacteria group bacterium]|nr:TetR/AcrR family transcriptional regulator [Patescibacteria group bacterium]
MMIQSHDKDPRVTRTRNLILNAFLTLVEEKSFEAITVKDIAERATVNRATFYDHFVDKYALLEYVVSEAFMDIVSSRLQPKTELTEETARGLILSMCDYQEAINGQCKQKYSSIAALVENKLQLQLQDIVITMLENTTAFAGTERKKLELVAAMISCSIYGAANHWYTSGKSTNASSAAEEILPFVISGVKAAMEKG